MTMSNQHRKNKKYKPLKQIGWIGSGFLVFNENSCIIRYYFEVRYDCLSTEIRRDEHFATTVIDMLEALTTSEGITSSPVELVMVSWDKLLSK